MTVTGPLPASGLGLTLAHEHLILDGSCFYEPATEPALAALSAVALSPENAPQLRAASCSNYDNLLLGERDLALAEIGEFTRLGGQSMVDLTSSVGLGRDPSGLRELATASGANIVMGCGFYCEYSHPDWIAEATIGDLERMIVDEFADGVDGVRPGIIGEIGINGEARETLELVGEMTPDEEKALRAAIRASHRTGAAVCIHQPNRPAAVPAILAVLDEEDADPSRVILAHMSSIPDFSMHELALERGYWIAYDNFGMAHLANGRYRSLSDDQRIDWTVDVIRRGRIDQLLISHDVWCKLQLRHFGGGGYGHILRDILPSLVERGVGQDEIERLLVHNPATVLALR